MVLRVATRNKLTSRVIPELAGIKIPHIDQSQESDAKFLTRLAERNGGEVSVKAGKLLFSESRAWVNRQWKGYSTSHYHPRRWRQASVFDCRPWGIYRCHGKMVTHQRPETTKAKGDVKAETERATFTCATASKKAKPVTKKKKR